jgi:ribonuclease HI
MLDERPKLVQALLLPNGGGWNEEMVRQHLCPVDAEDILKVPVGRPGSGDFLAWNNTKNGLFSVKSAYHLAMQRKKLFRGGTESSRSVDYHKSWLAIWDAQVPNKVKVHCWRLIENGLAVGSELSHRKIKDGVVCLACGRTENLTHRFWTCPHSQSAWSYLADHTQRRFEAPPKRLSCHAQLKRWLLGWLGKANGEDISWVFMMLYNLWQARNEARENEKLADPRTVAMRTIAAVEEWQIVHQKAPVAAVAKPMEHWLPPDVGWSKINADGSYQEAEGHGGGGVVIRDHHGSFVSGACHFFSHLIDAEGAELLACRRGLMLARECGVQKVVLEMDSTGVAAKLLREGQDRSLYGSLVEEIKSLLRSFGDTSVRAVRRSANVSAHVLAKEGCENKLLKTWFGIAPDCIVNQLVLDSVMF